MYRSSDPDDDLGSAPAPPGWRVEHYPQVGSTNDLAKQAARAGAPAMLALVADAQTAGRGRMGRAWIAPPGANLTASVILRPTLPARDCFLYTMLSGLAVCEAVEGLADRYDGRLLLKWPNDVLAEGADARPRKLAGILSEAHIQGEQIGWLVLGIGVNVRWSPTGVVDGRDLGDVTTSLSACGLAIGRAALLRGLLVRIGERAAALERGEQADLVAAWRARLTTIGQAVVVRTPRGAISGVAEGVGPDGELLVRGARGELHSITAGDVEA
jgi:BirA family transcriptional regulator, biotin operon repressor / biotin---[acetyl-CoA-carboxylase] ligase